MAGAGGEEPGHTDEDSLNPSRTPSLAEGSIFAFGSGQNGPFNPPVDVRSDADPRESLTFFKNRVSVSMLEQVPDYDTIQQMLLERERDLELAARIGQALLERNHMLESDLSLAADLRQRYEQQIAQLKYDLSKKEALVQLYLDDMDEKETLVITDRSSEPSWVKELTDECHQLRATNELLHSEAEQLRKEAMEVDQKENNVIQLCLDQLTSTKQNLSELREDVEVRSKESLHLKVQLDDLRICYSQEQAKAQHLQSENIHLKEKLAEMDYTYSLMSSKMEELQHRYEQCMCLLEERQSEIAHLKELASCKSTPSEPSDASDSYLIAVEHESIVHEIEEALRKEIIAASTLVERPRSPNHYAQQRTMVVMETVRAATMATAKRKDRMKHEQLEMASPSSASAQPVVPFQTPPKIFSPLLRSKTALFSNNRSRTPIVPNESSHSTPESLLKHRNCAYFSPEKLQIVKPLEGSVTLLRWKLLASPQLGGATTYFSAASQQGVHLKGWAGAGIIDSTVSQYEPVSVSAENMSGNIHSGVVGRSQDTSLKPSISSPVRLTTLNTQTTPSPFGHAKDWAGHLGNRITPTTMPISSSGLTDVLQLSS